MLRKIWRPLEGVYGQLGVLQGFLDPKEKEPSLNSTGDRTRDPPRGGERFYTLRHTLLGIYIYIYIYIY